MSTTETFPPVRLQDGETIVLVKRRSSWSVPFNKIITLGLFSIWWRRAWFVVTDRRVIARAGVFNTSETSLPMRFVQDASVERNWLGIAGVALSTAGGDASLESLSPLSPSDARGLADCILQQAHKTWEDAGRP
jgi:membrane protein YdbS with pleckstrin-like domain